MYSLQAVADTSQQHFGFYFVLLVMSAILVGTLWCVMKGEHSWADFGIAVVCFVLVVPIAALVSYSDEPPRNLRVEAAFVGFTAELEKKTGVKNQTTTTHLLYGNFQVPEGTVALPVTVGAAIPAKVILYKN